MVINKFGELLFAMQYKKYLPLYYKISILNYDVYKSCTVT